MNSIIVALLCIGNIVLWLFDLHEPVNVFFSFLMLAACPFFYRIEKKLNDQKL